MYNNTTQVPCSNSSRCPNNGRPQISQEMSSLLSLKATLLPIFTGVGLTSLLVALIGNLLIIWILLTDRRLRSMAHFFLINVAAADAIYAMSNTVGEISSLVMSPEALIATFCELYRPLVAVRFAVYAISVFCLASLSVERCHAICSPINFYSNGSSMNKIKIGVFAVTWIASIALSAPLGLCKVKVTKAYVIFLAVILHAIPLTIISVANLKIIISLRTNASLEVGSTNERERGKLLKLLVVLIVSFIIFWSPYHILFLHHTFSDPPRSYETIIKWELALRAGNTLTYFNSALNGVLYFAFGKSYRNSLRSLIARCLPRIDSNLHERSFSTPKNTEEAVVCTGITKTTQF